jgi:hypothetical protein
MNPYSDDPSQRPEVIVGTFIMLGALALTIWGIVEAFKAVVS